MATVDADPGEDAEVTVLVFNTGTAAEAFELQVVGPCSPWAFLDPAVVRLDAGDFSEARLVLRPPRIADVPAGPHPFGVRLTARTDPRVDEVAEGAVDVSPYEAFSARLVPEEVAAAAKARVRVEVQNDGNCPLVTRLEAADNDGHASFKWDDDTLFVPPGTSLAAWLTVRPRHRKLLSTKQATRYSVRIESASRVATLAGRIRARGALGSFMLRAAIVVVAVGAGFLGVRMLLTGDDEIPKTKKGLPVALRATTIPDPILGSAGAAGPEAPPASVTTAPAIAGDPQNTAPPSSGVTGSVAAPPPDVRGQANKMILYRFFDPALNDYLYVTGEDQRAQLSSVGLVEQGNLGHVLSARAEGTVPLFRLRHADGRHQFTYDEAERRAAISRGAQQEGITGYLYPSPAAGTTPVYRLIKDGVIYLTADNGDVQARSQAGWVNEGVRGYVLL